MSACESVRGEWGGICPDCGKRLPAKPGPMKSWKAQRETDQWASELSRLNSQDSVMRSRAT